MMGKRRPLNPRSGPATYRHRRNRTDFDAPAAMHASMAIGCQTELRNSHPTACPGPLMATLSANLAATASIAGTPAKSAPMRSNGRSIGPCGSRGRIAKTVGQCLAEAGSLDDHAHLGRLLISYGLPVQSSSIVPRLPSAAGSASLKSTWATVPYPADRAPMGICESGPTKTGYWH